jgi:hypothetical protein
MHDPDGPFPDDVPVADAVEQQRTTSDSPDPTGLAQDIPLEASAPDWQEQREEVVLDEDYDQDHDGA